MPPHERLTLPNGVKLILIARHDVPLIAFEAVLRGGARLDPQGHPGVASLTAELLTHGAGDRDAYAFADAVEGCGGSLDAEAHTEALLVHGQFLARDAGLMLELLADAVQRPRFSASELEKLRARRIEFIRATKDSEPQSLIGAYGRALLFGPHPYGRPIGGSESSLAAISREHVARYYDTHIGADRLTLVFAGAFAVDRLAEAVAQAFGSWRHASLPLPTVTAAPRQAGRRVLLVDAPGSAQTYFWIGNVGVERAFAGRAALDVANTAFGGSFGSMLMQALRVQSGLTYSASASFRRLSAAGEFSIGSFTQTEHSGRAVAIALQTLERLKRGGVTAAAIDSVRSYILGQYPLGFETDSDWAAALADLDLFGLPERYINDYAHELARVDQAATRAVIAEAYPHARDVAIALIGDAARIRRDADRLGPVVATTLAAPEFAPPELATAAGH